MNRARARAANYVRVAAGLGAPFALSLLATDPAQAVPSFAGQTGLPCVACHIGAYGPQLTSLGRDFKISGYTRTGGEGLASQIPLAVMALGSFNNLEKAVPDGTQEHRYGTNNNVNFDQLSLFLATNIGEHSGIFAQGTVENNFSAVSLDNVDIRPYTTEFDVGDTTLRVGTTLNNAPTVQDPYNTTYTWGYPYVSSNILPTPAATLAIADGYNHTSYGYTAYLWYDKSLYLEAGAYSSMNSWTTARLGEAYGVGAIQGAAPYVRAAYQWEWDDQLAHVGGLFMQAGVNPTTGEHQTDGSFGRNTYADYALDASYAWLGDGTNIWTLQTIYTHENQDLVGSTSAFNAFNGTSYGNKSHLDNYRLTGAYWYKNTYGANISWQKTWGPANPVLYQPAPLSGSANGKPNSNAFIFEVDWVPFGKEDSWATPFMNLKVGAQYTWYTQFNGGSSNYDGFGRSANNNNSIYLFAWMAF